MTTVLSTRDLMWDKNSRNFGAEASCIPAFRGNETHLILKSHKTGAARTFVIDRCNRDPDGDICSWVFVSGDLNFVIFND